MKFAYRIAGCCALAGLSANASAQGWIAGGAVGQAKQQDYEIDGQIDTRDDTDDAMRIFGGYMISPLQGVVASFVDLGIAYYDGQAAGGFRNSLDAEGYDISYILGWAPGSQERFAVFGTLGVFVWDQDVFYADAAGPAVFQDEGTSFSMGVGAEFKFSDTWGVHLEWQLFKDVGEETGIGAGSGSGQEYDREAVTLGVSYRFGGFARE